MTIAVDMERKATKTYKQTFPMASCNMKTCNHRKKCGVKNMKIRNCFCKYAIEYNQVG